MDAQNPTYWRRCSFCKKEIPFSTKYYQCSVSTCRQKRTGLVFCSSSCWDGHDGETRHRESWAEEAIAPTRNAWLTEQASDLHGTKPMAANSIVPRPTQKKDANASPGFILRKAPRHATALHTTHTTANREQVHVPTEDLSRDILIVASKLKAYIKSRAAMNTSDACFEPLSDELRRLSLRAIEHARTQGRKTVLERDFDAPPPPISDPTLPRDVLVVVSKLKAYIRAQSEMSTADDAKDTLSDYLRARCESAIRKARQAERKTVLERDFK